MPKLRLGLSDVGLTATIGVWLLAVVAGLAGLAHYAATPGRTPDLRPAWPTGIDLERSSTGSTLVLFLHPRCPCSVATLAQLSRLVPRIRGPLRMIAAVGLPEKAADDWVAGALWEQAGAIRDLRRVRDRGGRLATRFGATTSGHCLLYDRAGRLQFSGGITPARAHEGDNYGQEALLAALNGTGPGRLATEVYGCPLVRTDAVGDGPL